MLGFVERRAGMIVFGALLVVWGPTLLLRMAGGFQIVDYLGSFVDEYLTRGQFTSAAGLLPNAYDNAFVNGFHFRPVWTFIMQGLLVCLPGNYSLQFLIKIAVSATVVFLSYAIVRLRTGSVYPALLCAIIIIVHPAPTNLYLYTTEAFVAFFLALTLWWLGVGLRIWTPEQAPLAVLGTWQQAVGQQAVGQRGKPGGLRPFAIMLGGIAAFIAIALTKEYGFLVAALLCLCLAVFLVRRYRAFLAAALLLAAAAGLSLFCVYRVNQVRDTLMLVVAPVPAGRAFWVEFGHRIREGIVYLAPVQLDTRAGKVIGLVILALGLTLLVRSIRAGRPARMTDALGRVLSLEAVLLASVLAIVVLTAVPSGYPPRMSPRYVIPAIAPLAMLISIAWFTAAPRARWLTLGGAAFLLLAAPNITYQRDLDWALYNQAFAAYVDLLQRHQQRGDAVIVAIDGEIGNSIVNFFGPVGAAIFDHGLKPVPRETADLAAPPPVAPPRVVIASQTRPWAFMEQDRQAQGAVLERIEVVTEDTYRGSGMDRLVRAWNRIGARLGSHAQPYLESGTVAAAPGPRFYAYTLCHPGAGIACAADIRDRAQSSTDVAAGTGVLAGLPAEIVTPAIAYGSFLP